MVFMPRNDSLTRAQEKAALQDLSRTRCAIGKLPAPPKSGVYAIYLTRKALLAPFAEGEDGLIYIGLSSNLADREFEHHFSSENTGFSTLRRSLGAILKKQLDLRAIPRAPGPSETNVRNYRFISDGDSRLTAWMCEHLEVGIHASSSYPELEDFLVPELRPLLNLNKWPNPHRVEIKSLRKLCADEARQVRRAGVQP
jgi:hypothetical protein